MLRLQKLKFDLKSELEVLIPYSVLLLNFPQRLLTVATQLQEGLIPALTVEAKHLKTLLFNLNKQDLSSSFICHWKPCQMMYTTGLYESALLNGHNPPESFFCLSRSWLPSPSSRSCIQNWSPVTKI